eukprot:TRINITY_DN19367_c0_g4_i4.p1 TRINITY_DN19367_c0_g4~~TRINITY_DN19367_c0_g4_i4.p1  ORF type:complete len:391 (-),score=15.89 TRINITY_DN19367_c0_g4_i4:270-1442(-)
MWVTAIYIQIQVYQKLQYSHSKIQSRIYNKFRMNLIVKQVFLQRLPHRANIKQGKIVEQRRCYVKCEGNEFIRRRNIVDDGVILIDDENEPVIYAFWDLCDKFDEQLDPQSLTQNIYLALSKYGNVEKMYAYGKEKLLKTKPYDIQKSKRLQFEAQLENPLSKKKKIIKPYTCHICNNGFMTYEKLEKHFKIHSKQRQKEMGHKKTMKRRMAGPREAKYQSAVAKLKSDRDPSRQGDALKILKGQDVEVFWVNSSNQATQKIKQDVTGTIDILQRGKGSIGLAQREHIVAIISDMNYQHSAQALQQHGISCLIIANAEQRPRIRKHADYFIRWEQITRLTQKLYEEEKLQEQKRQQEVSKKQREYVLSNKTPTGQTKRRYDPMLGQFTEW